MALDIIKTVPLDLSELQKVQTIYFTYK